MKSMNSCLRLLVIALVMISVHVSVMAQTSSDTITHIMQRGETIQSIAARYSTTTQAIIELNPEVADFTYIGMEIKVPVGNNVNTQNPASSTAVPSNPVPSNTYVPENNMYSSRPSTQVASSSYDSAPSTAPWSGWGVNYTANFSDNGKGFYGLYAEILNEAGFGAFMSAGASYGITKKGQLQFRVGPDYGRAISENIMFSCPLALNVRSFNHIREIKLNTRGKQIENEDMKVAFGISLTPKIGIKIEKVNLSIGLDVNYLFEKKLSTYNNIDDKKYSIKYGGKAYVGFTVGLGSISF